MEFITSSTGYFSVWNVFLTWKPIPGPRWLLALLAALVSQFFFSKCLNQLKEKRGENLLASETLFLILQSQSVPGGF